MTEQIYSRIMLSVTFSNTNNLFHAL